ncbi:MAG: thioredoxin family protein [Candidatus Thorarchaeota archaeon]
MPGEDKTSDSMLYIFTQENCVNCPAAKMVVEEALMGTGVPLRVVDLQDVDEDLDFRMLEDQIFIASTPSIVLENKGSLKLLYSGDVPTVEDVRKSLGVN